MLELKDIKFARDGRQILSGVNLNVDKQEIVAITGPNGSGKSTLAKIIMGILAADSGKILLANKKINSKSLDERARSGIAYAFQRPIYFKGLTVADMMRLAAGEKNVSLEKVYEVLEGVGLNPAEYLKRELSSSLSGGEMKRIELAGVILRQPKVLICDEPEAGIDLWSFDSLMRIFEEMREKPIATIIITHHEKIIKMADRVFTITQGEIFEGVKK